MLVLQRAHKIRKGGYTALGCSSCCSHIHQTLHGFCYGMKPSGCLVIAAELATEIYQKYLSSFVAGMLFQAGLLLFCQKGLCARLNMKIVTVYFNVRCAAVNNYLGRRKILATPFFQRCPSGYKVQHGKKAFSVSL